MDYEEFEYYDYDQEYNYDTQAELFFLEHEDVLH